MNRPRRSKKARSLLLLLTTTVVMGTMVFWVGPEQLLAATRQLSWRGYLWLSSLYFASQLTRTWRIQLDFAPAERPKFLDVLAIANLHQFSNHLLPARLGELAFPVLLHRHSGIPPERSLALLLRIRLQEVFVLAVLFLAALGKITPQSTSPAAGSPHWPLLIALGGAALLLPVVAERLAPWFARLAANCVKRLLPQVPYRRAVRLLTRISVGLDRLASAVAVPVPFTQRLATFLLTLAVWCSIYGLFHETMRLSGNPVPLSATIVGASFANLAQILPINTFGSIGSMEAGWTLGFSLVGVAPQLALATALVVHGLVLSFLVLFSLPSWLWLRRRGHTLNCRRPAGDLVVR